MKSKQILFLTILLIAVGCISLISSGFITQLAAFFNQCPSQNEANLEEECLSTYLPITVVSLPTAKPVPSLTPTIELPTPLTSTSQASEPSQTPTMTPTPTITPTPIPLKPFYGIQYVPIDELDRVKELGFEVVLQDFAHDGSPQQWLSALDAAEAADIQIVGWFWPPGWEYDGNEWSIDSQTELFINTVADHPAFFALYSLHEPYWYGCEGCGYTTAELQKLYTTIKEIEDVPIYADMDELVLWADHSDETVFADGICDYCAVWYYPAKRNGTFRLDLMVERLDGDLALMKANAPNSKFIWSMQSFSTGGGFDLRMPTAEEMKEIAAITYERDIYGAWWYPWEFDPDEYDDDLSRRPDLHTTLHDIYIESVLPAKEQANK